MFLVLLIIFQHSVMARKSFKDALNRITANQYYYLDKPLYVLTSALVTLYFVYNFIPITDIAFDGF